MEPFTTTDDLSVEEHDAFAQAMVTLLMLAETKMGGTVFGTVFIGKQGDEENAIEFHVNIHAARLCEGDDMHTPIGLGSETLQ